MVEACLLDYFLLWACLILMKTQFSHPGVMLHTSQSEVQWCGADQAKKQAPHLKTGSPLYTRVSSSLYHPITIMEELFELAY